MLQNDPVELAVDSIGGVLAVAVRGALIGDATEPLRTCLDQAIRGARPVVLDLTEATGVDRRAIETLLEANRRLGTRLRLVVERSSDLHQAFRREGVSHVLSLHSSRAEALTAAAPR